MLEEQRGVVEAASDEVALVDEDACEDRVTLEEYLLDSRLTLRCHHLWRELHKTDFAVVRYSIVIHQDYLLPNASH